MTGKTPISPIEGQGMLDSMEAVPMEPQQMAPRRSIAGLLTPRRLGMDPARYLDIGDRERVAADPVLLEADLIDVTPHTLGAVSYTRADNAQVWVTLAPDEYTLAARSVRHLGEASRNRTIAAREGSGPASNRTIAASERSRGYTLDGKLQGHERYLGQLTRQQALLQRLAKASHGSNRGLSLLGGDINSLRELETFRTVILGSALGALSVRRGWTESQADLAYRTIEKRMVLDRANNEHLDYFESMVGLMLTYNGAKQAVFKSRKFELIAQLRKDPIE